MKINIWNIKGYKGFDDCDGESDYNTSFEVAMDSRFTKDMVLDVFMNYYGKKYRSVELGATLIECKEI
jgi:hypothetical protein